jgi:salicylate hydroxylase
MAPIRVGDVGGGVAGPVLAIFLKLKGYKPAVFECQKGITDSGVGVG